MGSDTYSSDTTDYGIPADVMYDEDDILGTGAGGYRDQSIGIFLYGSDIRLENGVIPTDNFLNASSDTFMYSYGGEEPNLDTQWLMDVDTETVESGLRDASHLYGLSNVGAQSDDLSTAIAAGGLGNIDPTAYEDGEYIGSTYFTDLDDPLKGTLIAKYSVGLGFMEIKTFYSHLSVFDTKGIAYFTYGDNAIGAPAIDLSNDDFSYVGSPPSVTENSYTSTNAWQPAYDEQIGLNLKFGHDATWIGSEALESVSSTSPLYSELSSSMTTIVQNILTTFPENVLTFARTRPLRLKHSDIYAIETDEELEDSSFVPAPTTTPGGSY